MPGNEEGGAGCSSSQGVTLVQGQGGGQESPVQVQVVLGDGGGAAGCENKGCGHVQRGDKENPDLIELPGEEQDGSHDSPGEWGGAAGCSSEGLVQGSGQQSPDQVHQGQVKSGDGQEEASYVAQNLKQEGFGESLEEKVSLTLRKEELEKEITIDQYQEVKEVKAIPGE